MIAGRDSRIPPVNPAVLKSAAGGKSSKNPSPSLSLDGEGWEEGEDSAAFAAGSRKGRGNLAFYELTNLGTKK